MLQLFIGFLLSLKQMHGFEMHQIFESLAGFAIDKIDKRQHQQQHQHAGYYDDGEQTAHVRLKLCFVLRQRFFFHLDKVPHLGTNFIHLVFAPTAAYCLNYGSHVILAAKFDDIRHLRHFGIH